MSIFARLRSWLGKADEAATDVEFAAMAGMHRAEDAVDEATGGRFYDAVEKVDEEAGELLERLHLEEEDEEPSDAVSGPGERPGAA